MNISVFGLGYVGCVSLGCLAQNGHHLIGVDVNQVKVDQINKGQATIIEKKIDLIIKNNFNHGRIKATTDHQFATLKSDICIIAVGTPNNSHGHLELSNIFKVASNIGEGLKNKKDFLTVVIRSTVSPGTGSEVEKIISGISNKKVDKDFAVVSNPEFLREGTAVDDYFHPSYTLIGGENQMAMKIISELYKNVDGEIIYAERRIAELIKYINNTFHALKVSFANEIGNICKALNIDSHAIMDIFVKDDKLNISSYYLKPGFSYGGSCLPKDLKGLQTIAHDYYLEVPVINSIDKSNEYQIQRAVNIIESLKLKKIGVLGISFKEGTDDFRNSPTIKLIEILIGKGYQVNIFDNNINLSLLTGTNKEFIDKHLVHISKYLKNNIYEVFKLSELILVTQKDPLFIDSLRSIKDKTILDFVRIDKSLEENNNYIGINW